MSKITFRADEDLIRQLEEYDASKSEVMRDALRAYLEDDASAVNDGEDGVNAGAVVEDDDALEELVAERVDAVLADCLENAFTPREPRDVNVNITLDGEGAVSGDAEAGRKTADGDPESPADEPPDACKQCGERLSDDAVYCSNCGEKASHRVFCECGDELRSDWGFCPGCGRRTPAADVLHDS